MFSSVSHIFILWCVHILTFAPFPPHSLNLFCAHGVCALKIIKKRFTWLMISIILAHPPMGEIFRSSWKWCEMRGIQKKRMRKRRFLMNHSADFAEDNSHFDLSNPAPLPATSPQLWRQGILQAKKNKWLVVALKKVLREKFHVNYNLWRKEWKDIQRDWLANYHPLFSTSPSL